MTANVESSFLPPKDSFTYIDTAVAYCQGEGVSGHPGVYLHLDASGEAVCPYCSHLFKRRC